LRDRWKIQDFETALLLQVADEIVLMHPLHDHDDTEIGCLAELMPSRATMPWSKSVTPPTTERSGP
jgi:hypothetical protein